MYYRKTVLLQFFIVILAAFVLVHALISSYTRMIEPMDTIFEHTKSHTTYYEWQTIAAYPWLFSNHPSKVLYSGLHNDLNRLLEQISKKTNKVALLRFSYPWQIMLQNQIYTLVKFGQVYNYIVMVGDEKSLQVCFELNLPCFNGTKYYKDYYKDIDPTVDALYTDTKHYKPMNWFKLRFYYDVLIRNYTILAFDTDIAFSRKNIWLSLDKYSRDVGNCDMIFMQEEPVNAGFFYSRSNPDTINLFREWINMEYTHSHLDEQQSFGALRGYYYEVCDTKNECNKIKEREMITFKKNSTSNKKTNTVSIRTFASAYSVNGRDVCAHDRNVDPCISTTIFVHPLCLIGQIPKITILKQNGFWLLEEHCDKNSTYFATQNNSLYITDIYRCKPIVFENSLAEKEFEKCDNDIAWMK